jgi:uncharacterized membrane protein YsdA (DUF1294 family)
MAFTLAERVALLWVAGLSVWAFVLFGFDKSRAGRANAARISEATLAWTCALGGWPGGLLGIVVFRHKSAKASFQLKFAAAFMLWAASVAAVAKLTGHW